MARAAGEGEALSTEDVRRYMLSLVARLEALLRDADAEIEAKREQRLRPLEAMVSAHMEALRARKTRKHDRELLAAWDAIVAARAE